MLLARALAELCARDGYDEIDGDRITAGAGLSEGAFERNFVSKEECALAAVEMILADGMAEVGAAYSADRSEWESVLRALRSLLSLFASRPAAARVAFIGSRQELPPTALQGYKAGFSILTAMLDRLREQGLASGQPPSSARAAIGGGEALVRRTLAAGEAERLPEMLPDLVYAATVPFLGQEEALRLARQAVELAEREPRPLL